VIGYDIAWLLSRHRAHAKARRHVDRRRDLPGEIEDRLQIGIDKPIPPRRVATSSTRRSSSRRSGRPVQAAGADELHLRRRPDDHRGVVRRATRNTHHSGVYRSCERKKTSPAIDIVTPNNMRMYAQRAYEAGKPCPILHFHRHPSDGSAGRGVQGTHG